MDMLGISIAGPMGLSKVTGSVLELLIMVEEVTASARHCSLYVGSALVCCNSPLCLSSADLF